jgi:4-amino-4-deoxy-L-arabinose transferase-like glycosyltransferase
LDPGRSGAGILFLIVGFRAVSRSELPTSVVLMGTALAALVSCMNHGLVRSPSSVWTSLMILLVALVQFWGRGKRQPVKSEG